MYYDDEELGVVMCLLAWIYRFWQWNLVDSARVMLEADLIRFLRLNELGVKNPKNCLRYYRERGKLRATKISNRNCYTIEAALDFLEHMTKKN